MASHKAWVSLPGARLLVKDFVDLQVIDVELGQVGQRGIPRAEIIDGHLDAGIAEGQQFILDERLLSQQQALGDFRDDVLAGQLQGLQQPDPIQVLGAAVAELHRRLVDADSQVVTNDGQPFLGILRCPQEDPAADLHNRPDVLGDRDEHRGTDETVGGVPPAQQRLGLVDSARGQLHDRLVVILELIERHRLAQIAHQLHALQRRLLHRRGEKAKAVAPLVLGRVHGLVGVAQHLDGIAGIVGINADPQAGGAVDLLVAQGVRAGQLVEDLLRQLGQVGHIGQIGDQDAELIATQAGHRVRLAHAAPDTGTGLDDQLVAHRVAQGVVDFLEMVQVDEDQRHLVLAALGALEHIRQAVVEQEPVGQLGQAVVVGLLPDGIVGDLAFGDVDVRAIHHQGQALGGSGDQPATVGHPHPVPVLVSHAHLTLVILGLARKVQLQPFHRRRQVVRVGEPGPGVHRPGPDFLQGIAQHLRPTLVEHARTGLHIPLPGAGPCGIQDFLQAAALQPQLAGLGLDFRGLLLHRHPQQPDPQRQNAPQRRNRQQAVLHQL